MRRPAPLGVPRTDDLSLDRGGVVEGTAARESRGTSRLPLTPRLSASLSLKAMSCLPRGNNVDRIAFPRRLLSKVRQDAWERVSQMGIASRVFLDNMQCTEESV
jgi:hypothetical protein